jgi:hypothetical protein
MRSISILSILLFACGDDDGMALDAGRVDGGGGGNDGGQDAGRDGAVPLDDAGEPDSAIADAGPMLCDPPGVVMPGECVAEATDYRPGQTDMWEACISDDGQYNRIDASISTIARIEAFEEIAGLLFDATADPSTADFTMARMAYQREEGLESRVVRRFDPHFTVPAGTDCTMPATAAMFPDYCVGPAILAPLILEALNGGIAGTDARNNAARVEAGLLWFLYASTAKESLTCTTAIRDCDSAYAYYAGGSEARCAAGLSRYVNEVDPYAHDRAWDGLLAVRCWRDLDSEAMATDTALRDRARDQYDRAVLFGVAQIVKDRLTRAMTATGAEQEYHWTFAGVLGRALDREMTEVSATDAATLRDELDNEDAGDADIAAAIGAIDAVFDCP